MNQNKKQYIYDVIETLSSKRVSVALIFLCGIFALFGLLYPFAIIFAGYDIASLPVLDIIVLIINVISALGFLSMAIVLYIATYLHQSILYYIKQLAMLPIFSIAGMVTLFIFASNTNENTTLPFGMSALCMMGSSIFFVFFFLFMKERRLSKEKEYHRKKTFQNIKLEFVIMMVILIGIKVLPIPQIELYSNIILIEILVIFISALIGQHMLATKLISQCREEFIELENTPYNASLRDGEKRQQRRLYIEAPIYHETALDVLEEFGLSRGKSEIAIHKRLPIYTFVEGMRLDFAYLDKILQRLRYEDIAFRVEEEHKGNWIECNAIFYDNISICNIHRITKDKKEKEEVKIGFIGKTIGMLIISIPVAIYFVWTFIFPINLFRPIAWMKENAIKECYKSFTYFDYRTFYHGVFICLCILVYLISPHLQHVYYQLAEVDDVIVVPIVFAIFFIGELFVFPLYIRRMQKVLNKEDLHIHNYTKKAFAICIMFLIFRIFTRGFTKAIAQIFLMICAVEAAKFLIVCYRYLRFRKSMPNEDKDLEHEFIEYTVDENTDIYDEYEGEREHEFADEYNLYPFLIEKVGNQYVATLEIGVFCREDFEKYNVYENGYAWESIMKSILKKRLPAYCDRVRYDSEAEQFVMLCDDIIILQAILKEVIITCKDKTKFCTYIIKVE